MSMNKEDTEINIAEPIGNGKIKRRRGRPPKIKTEQSAQSHANGSPTIRIDGQWVRKDESYVGDGVKAECQPEIQGRATAHQRSLDDLVVVKNEPIDDRFDDTSKSLSRFSSDTNDRSSFNIKEEPLDIYHENTSQDWDDVEAHEFYVEEVNYDIVKNEIIECDRQINENFYKAEMTIENSKNIRDKLMAKRHRCKYCNKTYKNKCHLSRHVNYECLIKGGVNKSRFRCSDCHIHFKTKYTMERHNATKHLKNGEKTSCDRCWKTFRDQKTLNRHLTRFACNGLPTTTFSCKNCNKEYRHVTSMWRHMKYECAKIPRFGCAHCDYMTLQKGNIVTHFRRKHAGDDEQKKYICSKCERSYKNEFTLKRHVNFECGKEPAFSCELCKFKTKRKFSLDVHVRNKH